MSSFRSFLFLPVRIASAFLKSLFHSLMKLRWTPSSRNWLMSLDKRIRSKIAHENSGKMVQVTYGKDIHLIWTVTVKGSQHNTIPIVIFHGMGGGSSMFLNNIDDLAKERDVILIDLPGFGLSSRPQLRVKQKGYWRVDTTSDDIEEFYSEVLNLWFEKMGLESVILLGHSYGGYISAVYCLKYPERIRHLILADPWGFPPKPLNADDRPFMRSKSLVLLSKVYSKMNIFTPLRILGPLGPFVLNFLRADLRRKFNSYFTDNTFSDYFYACNTCDSPSGEVGFSRVSIPFGWARKPLLERVSNWAEDLDVTFIFGSRSWVNSQPGRVTQKLRSRSYVDVQVIVGAGHHVYADRPQAFNSMVQQICEAVDSGQKPNIIHEYELRNQVWARLLRRPSWESFGDMYNGAGMRPRKVMSAQELSTHQEIDLDVEDYVEEDQGGGEKVKFDIENVTGEIDETLPSTLGNNESAQPLITQKTSLKTTKEETPVNMLFRKDNSFNTSRLENRGSDGDNEYGRTDGVSRHVNMRFDSRSGQTDI